MKYIISLILITLFSKPVFAQDSSKINNALLLSYYQDQRFDQAADYLKKTNPEPIADIKILKALAYCSQMNGKLPKAEAYYQRVYNLDSTNTGVLFSLGSINLRRGNTEKAKAWYKKIALKDSTNFIVYKQLATISTGKKDTLAELNYLSTANRLNPEDADVASDLSDLYIALNNLTPAEKILNTAIKADTANIVLLESLVKLEYRQSKWPETAASCEKLLRLGDVSETILTELGIADYNMGNYQSAINVFGQINEMAQNETTCYFIGASYKKLKNYDNALVYFQKTIDKSISNNIHTYYTELADTYETVSKYKKAAMAYQKAQEFNEVPLTYYSLANLFDTELKNRKMALLYYKKYLSAKPPTKQASYIAYAKNRLEILNKRN